MAKTHSVSPNNTVGQKMNLHDRRMTDAERWDFDLRNQPWTFVLLIANVTITPLGMLFVALGFDAPKEKMIAWCSWSAIALILFSALLAVWNSERKGLVSDGAKRAAWRVLHVGMWIAGITSAIVIFWPDAPWSLRVKAGGVLTGAITGLSVLRHIMKTANQALQPTPMSVMPRAGHESRRP